MKGEVGTDQNTFMNLFFPTVVISNLWPIKISDTVISLITQFNLLTGTEGHRRVRKLSQV